MKIACSNALARANVGDSNCWHSSALHHLHFQMRISITVHSSWIFCFLFLLFHETRIAPNLILIKAREFKLQTNKNRNDNFLVLLISVSSSWIWDQQMARISAPFHWNNPNSTNVKSFGKYSKSLHLCLIRSRSIWPIVLRDANGWKTTKIASSIPFVCNSSTAMTKVNIDFSLATCSIQSFIRIP